MIIDLILVISGFNPSKHQDRWWWWRHSKDGDYSVSSMPTYFSFHVSFLWISVTSLLRVFSPGFGIVSHPPK